MGERSTPTIVAVLGCALAAVCIDLGGIHRLEDGDSLLPVMISLQRWTPFMWEQDRFGMLMPLIALPFKDPLTNLMVQRGAFLFAGLGSFLVAARWAFGPERWQLLGLLGAALFVGLAPLRLSFGYLGDEPYGPSLLLGFGALVALEAPWRRVWRWPLAALLMGLGFWVNAGLLLCLLPASGAKAVVQKAWSKGAREWAWTLAGAAAAWAVNRAGLTGTRATTLNPMPPRDWPHGWATLATNLWSYDFDSKRLVWATVAVGAAGALALLSARWRRGAAEAARVSAALLLGGMAYFLAVGTHSWVRINDFAGRYAEPALPLWVLALLALLVVPLSRALAGRAFLAACLVAVAAVVGGGALSFGPPAPGQIRSDLARVSPVASEVVSLGCTHVAGTYWTVWPAVFLANATLYQRGERRVVYGLTGRAWPTWELAKATPPEKMRVAAAFGDPETPEWLKTYEFPALVEVSRGEQIAVLGTVPPTARE